MYMAIRESSFLFLFFFKFFFLGTMITESNLAYVSVTVPLPISTVASPRSCRLFSDQCRFVGMDNLSD